LVRVASVDLGTNTTRLLVADVSGGHVEELVRREAITRLGEGVDTGRRLLPTAIARVRNVLVDYRREAERLGVKRMLAVATSAVRDAENGEAFLRKLESSHGFATCLLDGRAEAELTFRGVTAGGAVEEQTLVVDIGGGSTELVLGGPEGVERAVSLDIGSVRLTERFVRNDPPATAELEGLAVHVRQLLPNVSVVRAVGVAGTVTTLAALDLGLETYDSAGVHGHRLSPAAVERQLGRLASLPLAKRRQVPALDPDRAPVIVAGAAILLEVMRGYELQELETSVRDLLDGAALAAAGLGEPDEGPVPLRTYP
jgi:exopolyphosphatase / guanosine-5'-triphosphate,3'-diphosphate pyrophosphatase